MVTTFVDDFRFALIDYFIFGFMIAFSLFIGIYFGYFRKGPVGAEEPDEPSPDGKIHKHADFGSPALNEYLLGSRKMATLPVAMSLVASYVSSITVIAAPAEIYSYGTQYSLILIPIVIMGFIVTQVYLPVYFALGLSSSYQYLALRFHPHMTSVAAILFLVDELTFLPIIVYGPALAFEQVTGVRLEIISLTVSISCTTYTLIGGIKAVVSTDAWQTIVMCLAIFSIVVMGTIYAGGFKAIFDAAYEGDRLELFNFSPSMYERNTFWSIMIGGLSYWVGFNAVNQTMVQRYMSLPTLTKAKHSVAVFVITIIVFEILCQFAGLIIFAYYNHCDPMAVGLAEKSDQLFPLYVMQALGQLHGIPGIFMAGVVGASLSSISVILNSSAAIMYNDIAKGVFKIHLDPIKSERLVKILIVVLAVTTYLLTFFVDKLGTILRTATTLSSIASSTTFGLFTLGMLIPWSNTTGAFCGALAGFFMTGWIAFGTQIVEFQKLFPSQALPVDTDGCEGNFTLVRSDTPANIDYIFPLYRLSYFWVSPIGILSVIIVGTIASFISGATDIKTLDPDLLSPVIHRYLPKTEDG